MSTLLAPGATHDCVAVDYWNAIAEPSEIQMFDWCGYVMDRLLDAVGKLKSEASKCSRAPNVMGCCLFLQVMYLDSIDLGIWNMAHTNLPRIRCFPAERMRSMILADKVDDGCGASENNFGKCKMRSPFGVCYHWASGSRRCGECPMKCRHVGLWEATISVVRNLRVPMEATGPVYLAIADFENHCIHLTGAGGLKFISALLSIIEPFNVGFRYSVGGCHNEFEPGCSINGRTAGDRGGESSDGNARKRDIPFTCAALSYFDDLLRGLRCVCCPEMGYWNSMTVRQQNGGRIYDGSYMGQCSVGYCSSDYSLETWDANLIVRQVMAKYYWFVRWSKVSSWTDSNIIGWGCCSKNVHVLRKVTVGIEDAKSPWDLGAQWRYDPDKVSSILRNWSACDGSPETNTSCFVHHTPKYIEVGASAVKQQFLGFSEMEMDMFDALMRRFKQCDDELYRGEGRLRWRHFIESDFMGSILAGVFDVLEPVVREHFVGSHICYDVPNCKMIFFPFILEHRWVCYAWRMEDNRIIIFDPGCSYVLCANGDRSHMSVVSALKCAIRDVAEEYFIGWMKSWDDATVEMFQLGRRQSSWINCSGILCAYFCRTFDGREMKPDLQTVDVEGISASLLGEVIHLENNEGRVLASSLL